MERKRLSHVELMEVFKAGKQVNVYFSDGSKTPISPYKLGACGDVLNHRGDVSDLPFHSSMTHEIIEPKVVRWINVYSWGTTIHISKELADMHASVDRLRCARVEV